MAHNYYEDYKLQFKEDRRNDRQPQLSELAQQGISYCLATLFTAAKVNRGVHLAESRRSRFATLEVASALDTVRARLLKWRPTEAIAASNHLTTLDFSEIFDAMRTDYEDLDFGDTLQREMYKAGAISDSSGAEEALFATFPRVLGSRSATKVMLELNGKANIYLWQLLTPEARDVRYQRAKSEEGFDPHCLINGRNPLYYVTQALRIADYLAVHGNATGTVTSGRIGDDVRFTAETAFDLTLTKGEEQNYPMLRRLRRAGLCYVHSFDLHLTYLTDLCRLIEACLPPETQSMVQSTADLFLKFRSAASGAKAEKLW